MGARFSSKEFPGFDRLWYVNDPWRRGALRLQADKVGNYRPVFWGDVVPEQPVRFIRQSGRRVYDVVSSSPVCLRLLSPRLLAAWTEAGVTGWSTFPIELVGEEDLGLTGYAGLCVTGRCGPIDPYLSEVCWIPPKCECGKPVRGLRGMLFEPATWDGSDVFCSRGSAYWFISERAKSALTKAKITGLEYSVLQDCIRLLAGSGRKLPPETP